jgi:predicted MFS family arabinose efflux permease
VVTAFYALGALLTVGVARDAVHHPPAGAPPPSSWRELREGVAHVRTTPRLLAAMWIAFLVNACAFPLVNGLMPYIAKEVYGVDQTGLGTLVACLASGAVIGSFVLSAIGHAVHIERVMIAATAIWYALLLAFSQMNTMLGGGVCLLLAGFVQSFTMVPLMVVLIRAAAVQFRGRVMGVRQLAIYSLPIGLLTAGLLIEQIGFHATATLYALVGLGCTALIAVRWREALWRPGAGES